MNFDKTNINCLEITKHNYLEYRLKRSCLLLAKATNRLQFLTLSKLLNFLSAE